MLNNNIKILLVSFVHHIELQNFLNAPRTLTQQVWITCERVGAVSNLSEPALVVTYEPPLVGRGVAADHQTVAISLVPVVTRAVQCRAAKHCTVTQHIISPNGSPRWYGLRVAAKIQRFRQCKLLQEQSWLHKDGFKALILHELALWPDHSDDSSIDQVPPCNIHIIITIIIINGKLQKNITSLSLARACMQSQSAHSVCHFLFTLYRALRYFNQFYFPICTCTSVK